MLKIERVITASFGKADVAYGLNIFSFSFVISVLKNRH